MTTTGMARSTVDSANFFPLVKSLCSMKVPSANLKSTGILSAVPIRLLMPPTCPMVTATDAMPSAPVTALGAPGVVGWRGAVSILPSWRCALNLTVTPGTHFWTTLEKSSFRQSLSASGPSTRSQRRTCFLTGDASGWPMSAEATWPDAVTMVGPMSTSTV